MTVSNKSVKHATTQSERENNWLEKQVDDALNKLKNKPIERRGPFVISDDDLNEYFQLP